MEIVLLFKEQDFTVPAYFEEKYGCRVFCYPDRRDYQDYIASIRPYLLWQYLREDSARERETYFYVDSDIIFREWPDFATLDLSKPMVYGGDCGSYLDYAYVTHCESGQAIADRMAEICGTTTAKMAKVPGIGAHLVLVEPTAEFWYRSYKDSGAIYQYLSSVGGNIQQWTSEMWAQLWGWTREDIPLVHLPDLDFCRPTDPIECWDKVKILHNAGVTPDLSYKLFYKGQYDDKMPFGRDFSWVDKNFASIKYVAALESVVQ